MTTQNNDCQAAIKLLDAKLDQLCRIAEEFPADCLWRRPSEGVVSLGNLLLHVTGSMRDWFENGLGQGNWSRDRDAEFACEGGLDAAQVIAQLRHTRAHCETFLAEVDGEQWESTRRFRDQEFTVREIVLHQLEHVAYHAGQAAFLRWLTAGLPLLK